MRHPVGEAPVFVLVRNFRNILQSCIHWTVSVARIALFRWGEILGVRVPQVQGGDGVISRLVLSERFAWSVPAEFFYRVILS